MQLRFFALALCILIGCSDIVRAQAKGCRIGVIAPLTGGMAVMGNALRNGVELAREEHKRTMESCEVFYEDDQYDGKQAIAAYQTLRLKNEVQAVFGFGSIVAQVLGPLVERDRIVLFNFGFEAAPVVGKKWVIRTLNHSLQYQKVMAAYLERAGVPKEVTIVRTELSFLNSMIEGLRASLGSGRDIREIGVALPGESDFRTWALKAKTLKPNYLGLFLLPEQLISFARQTRSIGWDPSYFGTDMFESASGLVRGEKLFEGAVYPDNRPAPEFRQRYGARFGNEDQLTFAANAYDMALLAADLELADGESFLQKVTTVRSRQGSLGNFSYIADPNHGRFFEYPITVKRIVNEKGVPVDQDNNPLEPISAR